VVRRRWHRRHMVWMHWTSLTLLIGAQAGRSTSGVPIDNRRREMVEGNL
jgi:hypothetical protein